MNDEEAGRMLERLADRVPVGPAPVDSLVHAGKSAQRRQRHLRVFGIAAAMTLVLGGGVAVQSFIGGGAAVNASSPAPATETPAPATDNPTGVPSGPLPEDGLKSCVEAYQPATVAHRAFAFDGVVVDIGPAHSNRSGLGYLDLAGVTFAVGEWFFGGTGPTVTIDMDPPLAGAQYGPAEFFHSYGIGSRLLVSGEPRWGGSPLNAPIAWSCGFTRYYDQQTAQSWRQAAPTGS
jgi:hypothetical protein